MSSLSWRHAALSALLLTHAAVHSHCAATAPVTGLGACIDAMAAHSARITRQVNSLGYRLHYGAASYTDHELRRIYIQAYDCGQVETVGLNARASLLAHELGHAEYGVRQDTASRSAYIQSWCDAEGHAVVNNIHARAETLECTGHSVDIGLAASNAAELLRLGTDRRRIGAAFCDSNFTSTTRQNYRDYYGAYYDAHY
ncbi:hypothetical protein [Acidovorax sp. CCYZU-2555]|uniref:hypothetical protein n=1 Tax=Acidovorax sp. CCYZU-2555 TaxID=2835042 RepID=UPI001BCE8280|nr:hypothetical protein [Acidovorax sp. CCYZU-2555]MBS7780467.1 hypothetical protein [Acidovorax sp. CCYZU-2555]